jgi:hypothetical protein
MAVAFPRYLNALSILTESSKMVGSVIVAIWPHVRSLLVQVLVSVLLKGRIMKRMYEKAPIDGVHICIIGVRV